MTPQSAPIRSLRRLRLPVAVILLSIVVARAEDDDLFTPSPFVQATAAFEQGDIARAETLAQPLADGEGATAEACALLGQVRLRQQRAAEAVPQFERAVAKRPASARLRSLLGLALLEQADGASSEGRAPLMQRARAELERAEAADGGCVDAQMGLLRYHLMDPAAGPAGAAERHAEAAATLDPLSATYEIGELAEKHGRFDLAERYYGVIADLISADPWLRFKHAQMLARQGRVPEARKELAGVLQTYPGFGPAEQLLAGLPAQ